MKENEIIYNGKKLNIETINEAYKKYDIVSRYLSGESTRLETIQKLAIAPNYIYDLIKKFEKDNKLCFINKKNGVSVNKIVTDELECKIINYYNEVCRAMLENPIVVKGRPENWFESPTFQFFYETIKEWSPIGITRVTQILIKHNKVSPRSRTRKTHNANISISDTSRCKLSGYEVQMDGKTGIKFPDDDFTCVAHSAVDAGTNEFISLFFDKEETNFGYLCITNIMIRTRGIPHQITTDHRTTFTTNRLCGDKNVIMAKGLAELACHLITTSNARRKNKVESKNDVIQMRLLPMLMLAGVRTMDQANKVVQDMILQINSNLNNFPTEENLYTKVPSDFDFADHFTGVYERKAHIHSQILYDKEKYFLISASGELKYIKKSQKVEVHETYEGNIFAVYKGIKYSLVIANNAAKKKYQIKYEFRQNKIYKNSRRDFIFKGSTYHIINNLGDCVEIKANSSICKVFDDDNILLYVTIDKQKYLCNNGPAPTNQDDVIISESEVTIKYDSSFKKNNRYIIKMDGQLAVFPTGTKVIVTLENGRPSYIIHKKKMLQLVNIDISQAGLSLPKSHHCSKNFWDNNDNVILLQA